MDAAVRVIHDLTEAGRTIATAESLTGGLVAAALTSVPGSSTCVRGGIVAYATELKAQLLGVDEQDLAAAGPVDADIAAQMAIGVTAVCESDFGVATTGVAGPDEQDGIAVGTVYVSVAEAASSFTMTRQLALRGDRTAIRAATVAAALELVGQFLVDVGESE